MATTLINSKDGTPIAFERRGSGPPLILVDGALCSRAFGPMPKLADELARNFTVFLYDRRGRGESGDASSYDVDREVDDLATLVEQAGGSAFVVGLSSGGALALEAAARGVPIKKAVAYEPPYVSETAVDHRGPLQQLVAAGDRGGAVRYFMGPMVGAPSFAIWMMRLMPWVWRKLKAVAHTLPYDAAVMDGFVVPTERLARVAIPALVLNGSKTDGRLKKAARTLAEAIPAARHRTLDGQSHNVSPKALAPAIVEFFSRGEA